MTGAPRRQPQGCDHPARLPSTASGALVVLLLLPAAASCVRYSPQPISPGQTAASFAARSLADAGLRLALEQRRHAALDPWPPARWDFDLLVLAALHFQPEIDLARATASVAEAHIAAAGKRPNPRLQLGPELNANGASGVSPWTVAGSLDFTVETAGKRARRLAEADYRHRAAEWRVVGAAWDARHRVRQALTDACAAAEAERLWAEQEAVLQEAVEGLERRLAAGAAARLEATRARGDLVAAVQARARSRGEAEVARARLAEALGVPAPDLARVSLDPGPEPSPPGEAAAAEARRRALVSRPDVAAALADYEAAQAALALEIARQYPDIVLGPGYAWDQGENKGSLGLSLTLPLLDRNQGPIAEATARRAEAAARFRTVQAQAQGAIDEALVRTRAAARELEAAERALAERNTRREVVAALLAAGEADRLDLLAARREQGAAALERQQVATRLRSSVEQLDDALRQSPEAVASAGPGPASSATTAPGTEPASAPSPVPVTEGSK